MTKFIRAISEDKFFDLFFEGVRDFISLDNDLVSDDAQNIMKDEKNREMFLDKIDELRINEDKSEVTIKIGDGNVKVRSF